MGLRQRVKELEAKNKVLLASQTSLLEKQNIILEQQQRILLRLEAIEVKADKKYITDRSQDDEPVPFSQVMDEYFNGESGDGI